MSSSDIFNDDELERLRNEVQRLGSELNIEQRECERLRKEVMYGNAKRVEKAFDAGKRESKYELEKLRSENTELRRLNDLENINFDVNQKQELERLRAELATIKALLREALIPLMLMLLVLILLLLS